MNRLSSINQASRKKILFKYEEDREEKLFIANAKYRQCRK